MSYGERMTSQLLRVDNLTKEQRRRTMQAIRSTNTLPERVLARELRSRRIYFAKHASALPGKPDFVFRRKSVAVFVDSEFWHAHPQRCVMPETNADYWREKLAGNWARDRRIDRELRKLGFKVVRLWQFEVLRYLPRCMDRIERALQLEPHR